jgi:hypothetical protein
LPLYSLEVTERNENGITPKEDVFVHLNSSLKFNSLFFHSSLYSSRTQCELYLQHIFQSVGINKPLVPKTDTQGTENLDKAISLDQDGVSMCSLQLSKHASTK